MRARVERERIDTLSKSIQANERDCRFFIARTAPLQIVPAMFFKSLRKGCQAKSELFIIFISDLVVLSDDILESNLSNRYISR